MTLAAFKRAIKLRIGSQYTMQSVNDDGSIRFEMPARELKQVNTVGFGMLSHKHDDGTLSFADFPKASNFSGDDEVFKFKAPAMGMTLEYRLVT